MQCVRPLKASFDSQGTITFSKRQADPSLVGFSFPCGKCLACHLNRAREKGIRAWHESKYHDESIFLTLTYDDDHLPGPLLVKEDHQNFVKRLRKSLPYPISVMVTGEYGSKTQRPHWHYIIFGWSPPDKSPGPDSDFGPTFTSDVVDRLWESRGMHHIGGVTLESASYVARYGAKALGTTDPAYRPFHRTGSKRALGRSWIEDNWKHTFENGFIVLPNGSRGKIPRYYVDWAKKHRPDVWTRYVTEVRPALEVEAANRSRKEELDFFSELSNWEASLGPAGSQGLYPLNKRQVEFIILKSKFKELAKNWSL